MLREKRDPRLEASSRSPRWPTFKPARVSHHPIIPCRPLDLAPGPSSTAATRCTVPNARLAEALAGTLGSALAARIFASPSLVASAPRITGSKLAAAIGSAEGIFDQTACESVETPGAQFPIQASLGSAYVPSPRSSDQRHVSNGRCLKPADPRSNRGVQSPRTSHTPLARLIRPTAALGGVILHQRLREAFISLAL